MAESQPQTEASNSRGIPGLPHVQVEKGHAMYIGGGVLTLIVIIVLLVLIF